MKKGFFLVVKLFFPFYAVSCLFSALCNKLCITLKQMDPKKNALKMFYMQKNVYLCCN